jgi:hypothetical protein
MDDEEEPTKSEKNLIDSIGNLSPAGTGMKRNRKVTIEKDGMEEPTTSQEEPTTSESSLLDL